MKLEKCPFCNGLAEYKEIGSTHDVYWLFVQCTECDARGKSFGYGYMNNAGYERAKVQAAEVWNRRAGGAANG